MKHQIFLNRVTLWAVQVNALAGSLALTCVFTLANAAPGHAQLPGVSCADVRPLMNWYSPSRGDNFATTNPLWGGPVGVQRLPDYKAFRKEGYVLRAPRPGTIELVSWYSSSRGDNFVTSDPNWAGRVGDVKPPDYRFVRVEGYIYDPEQPQPSNTLPFDSSYSRSREDNFASTAAMWTGAIGKANSPDYGVYRHEGFLFDGRHFEGCVHEIDESGNLPDFTVTDIHRSAERRLYVSIRNIGATGFVTRVECSTLGSASSNTERYEVARDSSIAVLVSIWPAEGRMASCGVRGVAADGVTPEPVGANNSLEKEVEW